MNTLKLLLVFNLLAVQLYGQKTYLQLKEQVLDEKIGDLDKDGVEEKAMVVSIPDSAGTQIRELRILKKKNWDWSLWIVSLNAVLPVKQGGLMGDPFEYIEIENGVLSVRQSGGSGWKWGQTDKYRFKNGDFELINYSSTYGKPCEYWAAFNYNISRKRIAYKKAYEQCAVQKNKKTKDEQENFKYKLKKRITLGNRYESYTTIMCPKLKQEISF